MKEPDSDNVNFITYFQSFLSKKKRKKKVNPPPHLVQIELRCSLSKIMDEKAYTVPVQHPKVGYIHSLHVHRLIINTTELLALIVM